MSIPTAPGNSPKRARFCAGSDTKAGFIYFIKAILPLVLPRQLFSIAMRPWSEALSMTP